MRSPPQDETSIVEITPQPGLDHRKEGRFLYLLISVAVTNLIAQEIILRLDLGRELSIPLFFASSFTLFYLLLPLTIRSGFNPRFLLINLPTAALAFTIAYLVEGGIVPFYFSAGYTLYLIPLIWSVFPFLKGQKRSEGKGISSDLLYGGIAGFLLGANLFFLRILVGERFFPSVDVWAKGLFLAIGWKIIPEELFYRGLLFAEYFKKRKRFWQAALVSSLFYSVSMVGYLRLNQLPLSWGLWVYLVAAGIAFAVLYRGGRSIIPSVIANIVFSAFFLLVGSG